MAELPEIFKISRQMKETLNGKIIKDIVITQEKCTNVTLEDWKKRVIGAQIQDVINKGKWIVTKLNNGENIALSVGMGADVLFFENEKKQADKYQIKVLFKDGSGYTIRFWWFGKFLLCTDEELASNPEIKDIAIDPFDSKFTFEYFTSILKGKRTQIKSFLMNQRNVSGIGNAYMHDILFKARLHPQKKISDMTAEDIKNLYNSIISVLNFSREKDGLAYEKDFFDKNGKYTIDDFLIGYKEKRPCPSCGETIISIKTGSATSFICPNCQKI
ncbi:MAG: Fpg/Nei family DNA glycosylase [Mollicutes bacterium]|jgi:formamidopyrimidine-DNA glycosylase|nr:Fpg/Nei family DNA glycosylase [Mollicutes bacterium]